MHNRTDITGHGVIVAGAASGIGRSIAVDLHRRGARVLALDRSGDGLASLRDEARTDDASDRQPPWTRVVDITTASEVADAVTAAEDQCQVHGMINAVGVTGGTGMLSEDVDIDDFEFVVRVNLLGAFHLSRAVLSGMRRRGYGRVLQIASVAGKEGNPKMVAYSATKAAMIGMVKSQGKEYAGTGVTVNALAPAVVWTPLVAALPDETVAYMTEKIPMGRCGELEEVTELAAWIVSPACSFTTGFTFDLTGGRATY